MNEGNPHIGSSFDRWSDEAGLRDHVMAAVVKAVSFGATRCGKGTGSSGCMATVTRVDDNDITIKTNAVGTQL